MVPYFYLNSSRANIFGTMVHHIEGGSHSRNTWFWQSWEGGQVPPPSPTEQPSPSQTTLDRDTKHDIDRRFSILSQRKHFVLEGVSLGFAACPPRNRKSKGHCIRACGDFSFMCLIKSVNTRKQDPFVLGDAAGDSEDWMTPPGHPATPPTACPVRSSKGWEATLVGRLLRHP